MSTQIGCAYCENGELTYFFKNETKKTVRTDFLYCAYCYPDSTGTVEPLLGEEMVSAEEFFLCLKNGWTDSEN